MKRKLLAIILVVAVLAMLLTGCSLFPVNEYRDYHQVVATVTYKDMSKDVLKGELLSYYTQYGATYIYYYGWTEEETLEYLCNSLARQNLLLLHAKEYLAKQADPDITDAEIAAMKSEDFLTVDERRYCIEMTNKSFEDSFRSLITELEEEQATNEGQPGEDEGETEATDEDELEARPTRPEEEESDEYVDMGLTDAEQLPEQFMDYIADEIAAEQDADARKNMNTALKELQDDLDSNFRDYAYYLNSQYDTRILDKYREALGGALPEITDEELNARYTRLVQLDIAEYVDEETYATALESDDFVYYHTTLGYAQVRSILLKFTDEQTDALETITALVGEQNEAAIESYRAILALGTDVAGQMPEQFASLADLGIKVNVSNPDYDADEDELADAYTDKGVDYKVILYAMADDIAAKVDKAHAAAVASGITDADQLALVDQYATDQAITDWMYLVNDDTGMFDSDYYVLSPDGSATSYVEEYTVLGRALANTGINSTAIVPTAAFEQGAAALAYEAAEGKEPTDILAAVNGKTYQISSEVMTSEDENGEELSTTVYTLRTEAGNDISFIVNDYGIHVVYVADKFVDESKGAYSEYTVDGEVKGYQLSTDYRYSYEVKFEYAEDEDGNVTDEIVGVTVETKTVGEYLRETIEDERTSAEFSAKQTEIFKDTSEAIVVQQKVFDGLLSDITG